MPAKNPDSLNFYQLKPDFVSICWNPSTFSAFPTPALSVYGRNRICGSHAAPAPPGFHKAEDKEKTRTRINTAFLVFNPVQEKGLEPS